MLVIDGIPLHPLVVHAVVVLLPLAALGAIVIALRQSWRRRLGLPVLLLAIAGAGAVPVATQTGEQLEHALPANPAIEAHAELGDRLLPYAALFAVLVAAAVIAEFMTARASSGAHAASAGGGTATATRSRLATGLAVLAALAGIGVTYLVVLIGHAGAAAAWQGVGQ
jgi:hypothetical protein